MTFQLDFKMMPPLSITEAEILSGIPDAENQVYTTGVSGSDLVTNGTFDDASAWTLGAGWAIGSGTLNRTPGSATNAFQTVAITAGRAYRVEFTISARTAGGVSCFLGGDNISGSLTANTTHSFDVAAGSSDSLILFRDDGVFDGSIDAVSVRELTHYSIGDQVWYNGHVWQSLSNDNYDNTPVEGANWTGLGEVDDGALEWASGTTYAQDTKVVYQGYVWSSVAGSNTGNTPSTTADPLRWTRLRRTFRYSPFDSVLVDTATLSGDVKYKLQLASLVTEIAILRADGATVNVTITDATDGEVYNQDFQLIDDTNVRDAWEYCFNPIIYRDTLICEDLPPYAGAEIEITLSGSEISVAQILLGQAQAHGITVLGTGVGIETYDYIERDDFNRATIVERPYSDTADFVLKIERENIQYFKREFAKRRALPTLYYSSGSELLGAVTYGVFRDLRPIHEDNVFAECTLETESLG